MRLLLFSDLHCDVEAASRLVEQSHQADLLIGAGDFGSVRRNVNDCIEVLRKAPCPAILVAGNNESTEELREACRGWPQAQVLHGSGIMVSGISFFGVGGGVPVTPFGSWSYDFTEAQAAALLQDCPSQGVLISHSPPKGAVGRSSSGRSLGSTAVRETIVQKNPQLVVCGHIHESGGQQARINQTVVVNAGPKGILWQLPGSPA